MLEAYLLAGASTKATDSYPVDYATIEGMPVSTLIYGEQWDAALRFMKDVPNIVDTSEKYITNSSGMGSYRSVIGYDPRGGAPIFDNINLHKTGINSLCKVKNIYDMADNVEEWTMEVFNDSYRVSRRRKHSIRRIYWRNKHKSELPKLV